MFLHPLFFFPPFFLFFFPSLENTTVLCNFPADLEFPLDSCSLPGAEGTPIQGPRTPPLSLLATEGSRKDFRKPGFRAAGVCALREALGQGSDFPREACSVIQKVGSCWFPSCSPVVTVPPCQYQRWLFCPSRALLRPRCRCP